MYPHPATILLSPCPPAPALHAIRPDAFADGAAVLPKQPTAADGSAEQLAAMHHLPWQREKSPAEAVAAERAAVPAAEQRSGWTLAELPALVLAAAAEQLPGEPVFAASDGLSEAALVGWVEKRLSDLIGSLVSVRSALRPDTLDGYYSILQKYHHPNRNWNSVLFHLLLPSVFLLLFKNSIAAAFCRWVRHQDPTWYPLHYNTFRWFLSFVILHKFQRWKALLFPVFVHFVKWIPIKISILHKNKAASYNYSCIFSQPMV